MRRIITFALAAAALTAVTISAASTPARAAAPSRAVTHTTRVVVRPVTAAGTPAKGYRVVNESIGDFSCTDGPSPSAVDSNIRYCGFSATYTVSCWKSQHQTVLCLRDPRAKVLARIRYTGSFAPVRVAKHLTPQSMTLNDGGYCEIRDGGAWASVTGHPTWFGTYFCSNRSYELYGVSATNGIDYRDNPWLVHGVSDAGLRHQSIHDRRVQLAYYVGTAA